MKIFWIIFFAFLLPGIVPVQAQTNVDIRGLAPAKLLNVQLLLGARFEMIKAQPAAASRADDAAFILRHLLQKDGYARAAVTWRIPGRNHIVLDVVEGPRLTLRNVIVEGADAADAGKLARIYSRAAEKDRPLGIGPPPYREQDRNAGLALIKQQLNANGYWAAEVSMGSVTFEGDNVDVVVKVSQGPKHRIGNASVEGNPKARGIAREIAEGYLGETANTKNLNQLRKEVEEAVLAGGYPNAQILMRWHLSGARFHPDFFIELGEQVTLRNVTVEGLQKTDPERVLTRLRDMQGKLYNESEMSKRMGVMLATGAFSTARVETHKAGDRLIDATLHLEEAKAREVSVAAGVDSYYGPVGRVTYTDRNWMGKLYGLSTGFEASSRGVFGEFKVADPWLWGSDYAGSARAFVLLFDRDGYLKYETGIEGGLDWRATDRYKLELRAILSGAKVEGEGLPDSELGLTEYLNPRLRFTQKLEFRNNPLLPTEGWHIASPFEVGSATGDGSVPYLSHGISGGWYHSIHRHYDIGIGGELGLLLPLADSEDLPIDLRFFNGGPRSVRSFPERELGPEVDGYATGGEAMWNANFELIRRITDSFKLVAFVDTGSLGRRTGDLFNSDVEVAAGLGVRFNLPIGPVRVEYGHNLTRDEEEPTGTFHFVIGTAF
ncbi:MAG: BamA/TamA family outer membrane protein [Verrucomicrobiota bacterium]